MDSSSVPLRKAVRKSVPIAVENDEHLARKSVMVGPDEHKELVRVAKTAKLTNAEYASAIIGYFAALGLNPAADVLKGLAALGQKVGAEAQATRDYTAA